jgi:phage terminase small subunit
MAASKKPAKRVEAGHSKASAADRRTAFVEAFLSNGGNALQAAISAGFSAKTAGSQGSRLLKSVEVRAQIDSRQHQLAEKYALTTDHVIRSISQELHCDPAKFYNADGSLKKIHDMDEDTRMALVSMESEEFGGGDAPLVMTRKVKWASKERAREQAMKFLGMFKADKVPSPVAPVAIHIQQVQMIVTELEGSIRALVNAAHR